MHTKLKNKKQEKKKKNHPGLADWCKGSPSVYAMEGVFLELKDNR